MVTRTPLATEGRRTALVAVLICWLFVVFDGYDLIVYGNVIPSLQREWGIGPASALVNRSSSSSPDISRILGTSIR